MFTAAKNNNVLGKNKAVGIGEGIPTLQELIEDARAQWQLAKGYFDFVKDPELVDLAIDNLAVAEKRYTYLLKQLHRQ